MRKVLAWLWLGLAFVALIADADPVYVMGSVIMAYLNADQ